MIVIKIKMNIYNILLNSSFFLIIVDELVQIIYIIFNQLIILFVFMEYIFYNFL
jgi:hypothetical protein